MNRKITKGIILSISLGTVLFGLCGCSIDENATKKDTVQTLQIRK